MVTTVANRINWVSLGVAYLAVWILFDRLSFPVRRDELHFWPTALRFSQSAIPRLDFLRDYGEMATPLPFIVWGWIERLLGAGVTAGRHLNFALSLAMALTVASGRRGKEWHAALAAAGLLACPYFLGTSVHLYTDIMAAFFAVSGVALHLQRRYVWSAVAFILGISSRQVIVAFPIALLAFELLNAGRTTGLKPGATVAASAPSTWALIAPLVAALSFMGWVLWFRGVAPPSELDAQAALVGGSRAWHLEYSLFFLTTIGLYFVLPELLLFGAVARPLFRGPLLPFVAAVVLLIAFVVFPPLENPVTPSLGLADLVFRRVLPDVWRVALYFGLAAAALLRFLREPLPLLVTCANAMVLAGGNFAWEKYGVPTLAVLWYLKSRQEISGTARKPFLKAYATA